MLDRAALERTIDAFWHDWQRGVHFPPAWRDRLDLEDAYRVQLGLVARRCTGGVTQVGWKVGLTAKAIQDQFNVHEPVFGCLLSEGRILTGHAFRFDDLRTPGFENEVCIVLSRSLEGSGLSLDDVRLARRQAGRLRPRPPGRRSHHDRLVHPTVSHRARRPHPHRVRAARRGRSCLRVSA